MKFWTSKINASLLAQSLLTGGLVGGMCIPATTAHRAPALSQPAAAKPNFTGVWKLDMGKSKMPDGTSVGVARGYKDITMSLIHVEPDLAVSYDIKGTDPAGDRSQSYIVKTDGVERRTVLSGGAATVWAKWQGSSLLIHHTRAIGADGSTSTTRSFTMSEEGKTLTSVPTFAGRQAGRDMAEYGGETEYWGRQ